MTTNKPNRFHRNLISFLLSTVGSIERKSPRTLCLCVALVLATVYFNFETVGSIFDAPEPTAVSAIKNPAGQSPSPSLRQIAHRRTTATPPARQRHHLDFFIAGFPKCGTTTLLYSFNQHNETDIGKLEKCSVVNPMIPDGAAFRQLDDALDELSPKPGMKRGIKCPAGIKNGRVLERLQRHSPATKLIVGVRHPVLYFQSYYNYRITEIYDRDLHRDVPPIDSLLRKHEWKGVSTDNARFELFLMQLGKTNVTTDHLADLFGRPHMAIKPNSFKIFFYALEQMEDRNTTRSHTFRRTLQQYLGLKDSIPSFGHENLNHFVGRDAHKETVDICEDRYADLRHLLTEQAISTAQWIKEQFLVSPEVHVANVDHLEKLLDAWADDPCVQRAHRTNGQPNKVDKGPSSKSN